MQPRIRHLLSARIRLLQIERIPPTVPVKEVSKKIFLAESTTPTPATPPPTEAQQQQQNRVNNQEPNR
ncbi:hypothetical protein ANCCAN_14892 [Ancylostoma caninum]|uniref:Uncharacterized protein n=1 Tax=Ancylostoma caninum TaxID=29170 RepID=A0A368G689_ANCCA|nr:hypothetical protein ANCCAN_14892 [Ancylostoma caninum]